MKTPERDDLELIKQFKSGTVSVAEGAFTQLVNKYSQQLYWQIRRMTKNHEASDDVLQNVWIKVWKNLTKFQEKASFYSWVYRIARNETINYLQKEKSSEILVSIDESLLEFKLGTEQWTNISAGQISEWLLHAIDELPEKQGVVFQLKYFEDLTYQEIALQLGTSIGGLKANYHHAVQKIQEFLLKQLNH